MSDLYRVLSGEIAHKYLIVRPPTMEDLVKAETYSSEIFNDNFEKGVFTIEELCEDLSEQQDCIIKRLEALKVEYYKVVVASNSNDSGRFLLIDRIEEVEEELSLLLVNNRRLEPFTCEGVAYYAKYLFLLARTTLWSHNRQTYDWSKASITQVYDWHLSSRLSEYQIRAIARSREWRQIWNIKSCGELFSQSLFLLSEEQKDLLFWSSMYDSANESGEAPIDEVVQDDHAFDGWLIDRHKQRQRETLQASKEKFSKAYQAQDVFIPVNTPKDIQTIQTLNSPEATGRKMTLFKRMNEDAKTERTSGNDG